MFSQEIIDTVKWAHYLFDGELTFCGSFGLKLNGLIDREVKDIDVITDKDYYGEPPEKYYEDGPNVNHSWGNSGKYTVNGNTVYCFKIEHAVHNIVVDVMYTGIPCKYTEVEFHGIKIRVETPQGAITAKEQYIKSPQLQYREKHEKDLTEIKRNYENNRPHASRGLSEAGSGSANTVSANKPSGDDIPF